MTTTLPDTPSTRISLSPMASSAASTERQIRHPEIAALKGNVSDLQRCPRDLMHLSGQKLFADPRHENTCFDGSKSNDPRFVLPTCELPPRSELEPVEMFVENAVKEQHYQQDSQFLKNYGGMIEAFRFKKDLPMLRKLMIALRTSGSTLNLLTSNSTKHARLIHQVVRLLPFNPNTVTSAMMIRPQDDATTDNPEQFVDFDFSVADAQLHLILALVSANSVFLVPAMTSLWKMLTFQISNSHPERSRRIHAALATMMRLCPKAKTELLPIIASNAPFRMRPEAELVWYYKQCLVVLEYLPLIRGQILELIVERCLEVDVEIKITDIGEATIETGDSCDEAAIFHLDLDEEDEKKKQQSSTCVTVDEMADKLDSLMLILFEHAEHALKVGIPAVELYEVLSRVFQSAIIITHKSKFVQFLILHVCGLELKFNTTNTKNIAESSEHVDEALLYRDFASNLINVILDPYRAIVTRQSGACYLASFVSRASFVCEETVSESINALLRWAEAYIKSLVSLTVHAPDAREQCSLHSLFYTVCQSAFYIMCFRGREVLRYVRFSPEERPDTLPHIDLSAARWTELCSHPLLPLRYCLESVRTEFLRISKIFCLLEDDVLVRLFSDERYHSASGLQRKVKSVSIITTAATLEKERLRGGVGGLGRGTNPLDSFFPFDPYLLRRSHGFIEPFYKHWDGGEFDDVLQDDNEERNFTSVDGREDETVGELDTAQGDSDLDSDDEEEESGPANARKRAMSFASNATSVSSRPGSLQDKSVSAQVIAMRGQMKEAWSTAVKRARAPSSENGSW